MPEPTGELVDSETITDTSKEWEYDLENGETITVVAKADGEHTRITASIDGPDGVNMARIDTVGRDAMQLTAEESAAYQVDVDTGGTLTVDIYIG